MNTRHARASAVRIDACPEARHDVTQRGLPAARDALTQPIPITPPHRNDRHTVHAVKPPLWAAPYRRSAQPACDHTRVFPAGRTLSSCRPTSSPSVPAHAVPRPATLTPTTLCPTQGPSPAHAEAPRTSRNRSHAMRSIFHPAATTKHYFRCRPDTTLGDVHFLHAAPSQATLRAPVSDTAGARLRPPRPAPPGPSHCSDGCPSAIPACPQPEHTGR